MKKIVIGIIIGAALSFSGQALAETISNVGKKIQNEYTVVVDGRELDKKSIAVDGSSYTPNRLLAEAVGYEVDFKDNTVILTKKEEPSVSTEVNEPVSTSTVRTVEQIDEIINGLNKELDGIKYALHLAKTDDQKTKINQSILELENKIKELELEKSQLEAQQ